MARVYDFDQSFPKFCRMCAPVYILEDLAEQSTAIEETKSKFDNKRPLAG